VLIQQEVTIACVLRIWTVSLNVRSTGMLTYWFI